MLAVLTLGVPSYGSLAGQTLDRPELREVDFVGNQAFPDDSLARAIVSRPSDRGVLGTGIGDERRFLDRRELARDVERIRLYYFMRGYRSTRVDTLVAGGDDRVEVTFRIEEGRPVLIDQVHFVGFDPDTAPDLMNGFPARPGRPLSQLALDAGRDTLRSRLRNTGYAHADVLRDVTIPAETPFQASVTFDVFTGPRTRFGEFSITIQQSGAGSSGRPLSEQVVRRMLPFEPGDRYSREGVAQAQRNLYSLDIIRNASVGEDLGMGLDTIIPLTIGVSTADVHRVRTGGGWSTADCVTTEARWISRNFFGGARRLQVTGRLTNILAHDLGGTACAQAGEGDFADLNWVASVELNQPWVFSSRNSLTTSVFLERESLPDVFIRRAVGFNVALTRSLDRGTPLVVSYRPARASLEAAGIFFCTSFLVCSPEDVRVLEGDNWLSPLGLSLSRNRTDDLINPGEGYSALLDLEHASGVTGSDFAYERIIAEVNRYQSYARRTVFAARVRAGWIRAGRFTGLEATEDARIVHPQKRFYAGGANSVRGFAQNRLGPRVLTVDAARLLDSMVIAGPDTTFQGCAPQEVIDLVCDAGHVSSGAFTPRPTGGTRLFEATAEYRFAFGGSLQGVFFVDAGQVWAENETIDVGDLEWTPGLGVRYFSPIGPLRVDVGYRFQGLEPLPVITSLRAFDPETDDPARRIRLPSNRGIQPIPWVAADEELAVLDPRVSFGSTGFFERLQLHISIGQAF